MKILVAHNRYQRPGGEDSVFESEVELLAASGHDVRPLVLSNDVITSHLDKVLTTWRTAKNPVGMAAMSLALKEFKPDVVHIHNFFPLFSPAAYKICRRAGSAVVQTLHNYRPICAGALLLRNGHVCRLCVDGSPLWGVVHRCYRNSIVGSAAVSRMIAIHRRQKTWSRDVDRFVALTKFAKDIFVEAGFPENRIDVKPNFIVDPGEPTEAERGGVLFVGRLSQEKGVKYLIEACARYQLPLRIAGDGPEFETLSRLAHSNVTFLGQLSRHAIIKEMMRAAVVAMPSLWYEGFPNVILEAFACGTPVIVSQIGSLAEIVETGLTGYHVPVADVDSLGVCIKQLLSDPLRARQLGRTARRIFLERYTPAINLPMLENIYSKAAADFAGICGGGTRARQ
jgi:glycosyltransferase involved in cell wall biosynthesis